MILNTVTENVGSELLGSRGRLSLINDQASISANQFPHSPQIMLLSHLNLSSTEAILLIDSQHFDGVMAQDTGLNECPDSHDCSPLFCSLCSIFWVSLPCNDRPGPGLVAHSSGSPRLRPRHQHSPGIPHSFPRGMSDYSD